MDAQGNHVGQAITSVARRPARWRLRGLRGRLSSRGHLDIGAPLRAFRGLPTGTPTTWPRSPRSLRHHFRNGKYLAVICIRVRPIESCINNATKPLMGGRPSTGAYVVPSPDHRRDGRRSPGRPGIPSSRHRAPRARHATTHQRGLLGLMDDVGTSLHSMRGQAPLDAFRQQFTALTNFGSGLNRSGWAGAVKSVTARGETGRAERGGERPCAEQHTTPRGTGRCVALHLVPLQIPVKSGPTHGLHSKGVLHWSSPMSRELFAQA